jgi:hypothetical protein
VVTVAGGEAEPLVEGDGRAVGLLHLQVGPGGTVPAAPASASATTSAVPIPRARCSGEVSIPNSRPRRRPRQRSPDPPVRHRSVARRATGHERQPPGAGVPPPGRGGRGTRLRGPPRGPVPAMPAGWSSTGGPLDGDLRPAAPDSLGGPRVRRASATMIWTGASKRETLVGEPGVERLGHRPGPTTRRPRGAVVLVQRGAHGGEGSGAAVRVLGPRSAVARRRCSAGRAGRATPSPASLDVELDGAGRGGRGDGVESPLLLPRQMHAIRSTAPRRDRHRSMRG